MSKGRKRKTGVYRSPNGQPAGRHARKATSEYAAPTVVRRVLDEAKRSANHHWLGSELGRLRLTCQITDRQLDAGKRYGEVCAQWGSLQGIAIPFPRPARLEEGRGGVSGHEDSPERVNGICRAYDKAREALRSAGQKAVQAVDDVCVLERLTVEKMELKRGLDALAEHFAGG